MPNWSCLETRRAVELAPDVRRQSPGAGVTVIALAAHLLAASVVAACLTMAPLVAQTAKGQDEAAWRIQFFHDETETEFNIRDLAFPSARRGIAVGSVSSLTRTKTQPLAVVTSDGGATWSRVELRDEPVSVFFLNDSDGWMVTQKGIWRTEESGLSWRRISKIRGVVRVYFLTRERGWAAGVEKAIHETRDGGNTWTPLPVASEPKTTKEFTVYSWIEFANREQGVIAGYSQPPRRERDGRFPDWMDPEGASRRRQWPTTTVVAQTLDGGETWRSSTTSMFGQIARLRMTANGAGLALVRFTNSFEWPSEVFRFNLREDITERVYREKNRSITDVAVLDDGTAFLAGFEPPGQLPQSPIPGKLVVLRSRDMVRWEEMSVDYRAFARRVTLAAVDSNNVWAATDTGMILKLNAGAAQENIPGK